jgi:hypothetical protein
MRIKKGETDTEWPDATSGRLSHTPMRRAGSVFLHVGFAHSGTTFLQENIFPKLQDSYYCGAPYGDLGGIFSTLKYIEDFQLADAEFGTLENQVSTQIFEPAAGRNIIISDETFSDWTELFFAPAHVPRDVVANRLHALFPNARILFTLREQVGYLTSCYLNLKRNFLKFDGLSAPGFHQWFEGLQTQMRCLYLQNLNYSGLIAIYAGLFGRENVFVLPLELLIVGEKEEYKRLLSKFLAEDIARWIDDSVFRVKSNPRLTRHELLVMELAGKPGVSWLWKTVMTVEMREEVLRQASRSRPVRIELTQAETDYVLRCVAKGNQEIESLFGVGLRRLGYMV